MIEAISNHRSVREYKTEAIPQIILNEILEAGSRASTTGNMQVYSMIVTKDAGLKEKLWESHFKQKMVLEAPVHITFCADFNRFNKWCKMRKAEPGYDNYLSFFTGAIDALLASQNVVLEAEAQGFGACYLGTAIYNAEQIIDILELPRGVVPVACIVLGYPKSLPELTDRLPMQAVVHNEKYEDFDEKKIDACYQERDNSEETKELLEINKKETLAQIFTENRYTLENNIHFSKKFLEVIKKQGFMEE
jgi:FMN reductase (NADPH)